MNAQSRRTWDDALAPHRAECTVEDLLLVLDDPSRLRLLVAWPHVTVQRPARPRGITWEAVWLDVSPDFVGWANCAETPLSIVCPTFDALRAVRLIFPDGTISEIARATLRRVTVARLKRYGDKRIES